MRILLHILDFNIWEWCDRSIATSASRIVSRARRAQSPALRSRPTNHDTFTWPKVTAAANSLLRKD